MVQGWMQWRREPICVVFPEDQAVIMTLLVCRLAETTASTAAALSRQPTTYSVDMNTLLQPIAYIDHTFSLNPSCYDEPHFMAVSFNI